jgi:hypothetical protein
MWPRIPSQADRSVFSMRRKDMLQFFGEHVTQCICIFSSAVLVDIVKNITPAEIYFTVLKLSR